ncbi:hypothetical protein FHG87_017159 [Trinorchestia longiramus]|nr:hypothetical protein FHG87_017159 [Trinorchestia longiramus]
MATKRACVRVQYTASQFHALAGVLASTEVLGGVKGDSKEEGGGGGGRHVGRPVEYSSTREDGVRIIEGALIGARGMEDLQTDLTAWNLVDNVSICLCKRRHEEDELGLCRPDDFALGFTTSDQLDLWADRGHCAVCLDTSQVRMSSGKDRGPPETVVSVSCVLVLSERGDACPVAWLLTSCYSDALHRHFLMCLRVAFESFQGRGVPEPRFLVCEASSQGQRLWQEAFKCSPSLLLSSWGIHKLWLPQLYRVQVRQEQGFELRRYFCLASSVVRRKVDTNRFFKSLINERLFPV